MEGRLTKWNDEKGFGFITPAEGGRDIFVHISAFPKGTHRPRVGERVSFDIQTTPAGKTAAGNLHCLDRPSGPALRHPAIRRPARRREPAHSDG